jgi:hypothetical protein
VFVDFQLSVVYVMVTFLMVDRALVTFTETVTMLLDVGDVGLMTGVPITGGAEGGA